MISTQHIFCYILIVIKLFNCSTKMIISIIIWYYNSSLFTQNFKLKTMIEKPVQNIIYYQLNLKPTQSRQKHAFTIWSVLEWNQNTTDHTQRVKMICKRVERAVVITYIHNSEWNWLGSLLTTKEIRNS